MKFTTLFFDLDDTLYPGDNGLWLAIKNRISDYMTTRMGIPEETAAPMRQQYFEQYGTTLRGLQIHHQIDTAEYLSYVHHIPLEKYLKPDLALRTILSAIPARKYIFTNADVPHARRVLTALGLENCFDGIIDVVAIAPYCKPMPESFEIALRLAREPDPARCVLIDDLRRTTRAARAAGLYSIIYGQPDPQSDADAALQDWMQLPYLLT
jgi:pyrimidine 5'-nucleotidase